METKQERLNKEIQEGKSIAWWAIGYYTTTGNEHSPSLEIPIFDIAYNSDNLTCKVLVNFLESLMWINVWSSQVHYGQGGDNPSEKGKEIRCKMEQIQEISV